MQIIKQLREVRKLYEQLFMKKASLVNILKSTANTDPTKVKKAEDILAKLVEKRKKVLAQINNIVESLATNLNDEATVELNKLVLAMKMKDVEQYQSLIKILEENGANEPKHNGNELYKVLTKERNQLRSFHGKVATDQLQTKDIDSSLVVPTLTQLMYLIEKNGDPVEHAIKLNTLFGAANKILDYLLVIENRSAKDGTEPQNVLHDACVFEIPEMKNLTVWSELASKYYEDDRFWRVLPHAKEIELELQQRKTPKILIAELEQFKKKSPDADLDQLISDLKKQADKPIEYNGHLSITVLMAVSEIYFRKSNKSYRYLLENGIAKKHCLQFEKIKPVDNDLLIPRIYKTFRDGEVYIRRLNLENKQDALLAATLGKHSGCCAYLGGAGSESIEYGLQNEDSGFYVMFDGKTNKVIGQTWALRSKTGAIILNSIEASKRQTLSYGKSMIDGFEFLARVIVADGHTHKVVIGAYSGLSSHLGVRSSLENLEEPETYNGYRNSHTQRVLCSVDAPYYELEKDWSGDKETIQFINDECAKPEKIKLNHTLVKMINCSMLLSDKDERHSPSSIDIMFGDDEGTLHAEDKDNQLGIKMRGLLIKHSGTRSDEMLLAFDTIRSYRYAIDDGDMVTLINYDKSGFLPDIRGKKGRTALMAAALAGDLDSAQKLLEYGVNIDAQDSNGETALHCAVRDGNLEMTRLLLSKGANIHQKNDKENSAIAIAVLEKQADCVRLLIDEKANLKDYLDNNTLLCGAVRQEDATIVQLLIDADVDVNYSRFAEYPKPLRMVEGSTEILKILLQAGAEVDAIGPNGDTALYEAINDGNKDFVQCLIEHGANPDKILSLKKKRNEKATPLELAKKKGNQDIVKLCEQYSQKAKQPSATTKQKAPVGGLFDSRSKAPLSVGVKSEKAVGKMKK